MGDLGRQPTLRDGLHGVRDARDRAGDAEEHEEDSAEPERDGAAADQQRGPDCGLVARLRGRLGSPGTNAVHLGILLDQPDEPVEHRARTVEDLLHGRHVPGAAGGDEVLAQAGILREGLVNPRPESTLLVTAHERLVDPHCSVQRPDPFGLDLGQIRRRLAADHVAGFKEAQTTGVILDVAKGAHAGKPVGGDVDRTVIDDPNVGKGKPALHSNPRHHDAEDRDQRGLQRHPHGDFGAFDRPPDCSAQGGQVSQDLSIMAFRFKYFLKSNIQ
ncbi:hypothetical protein CFIICLFH_2388 [Methylobacterium goesingense]|nr:hypothetical protein CFIICLFH_2388 [Methylobacterium goesingense]